MSKTYTNRSARPWLTRQSEEFRCRHCRTFVGPTLSGGRHRNHCPACLYSRHVDESRPGDRASLCGASMRPVGVLTFRNGEQSLLHRCDGCDIERTNRIAADDDLSLLLRLPPIRERRSKRAHRQTVA